MCPVDMPLSRFKRDSSNNLEQAWRLAETYKIEWRKVEEVEVIKVVEEAKETQEVAKSE